ncbi:hypothetical protein GGI04_002232 [Coemansia thaxteri]|nr:hypothetical protein GGI04_002232 [Coemansia thaxteri]
MRFDELMPILRLDDDFDKYNAVSPDTVFDEFAANVPVVNSVSGKSRRAALKKDYVASFMALLGRLSKAAALEKGLPDKYSSTPFRHIASC